MTTIRSEMTASDVVEILQLFSQNQIEIYVDGGWGVDALLGRQTRPHADLDIAVEYKDIPVMRALLASKGYADVPREDTWEHNFVVGDANGHLIDIHSYLFDSDGNLLNGVAYPFDSLRGAGVINGYAVKCITPEWMVKFHTGYPLDDNDYHDVKLLCQRFNLDIPSDYVEFVEKDNEIG